MELEGTRQAYYVILLEDSELRSARLGLNMNEEGYSIIDINFEINREEKVITLELSHFHDSNTLFYRWPAENGEHGIITMIRTCSPIQVGQQLPEMQVKSLDGEVISLSEFAGKYVVINWWARFCAPCIIEMPGLNELVQKYDNRNDLEFLAIGWDDSELIRKFLETREFLFKHTTTTEEVTLILEESFPRHVIIDPDGVVIFDKRGGHKDVHLVHS